MSPAIVRAPATKPAVTILREAIIWAQLEGYRIRLGTAGYGVQCSSRHGNERWERDPREEGVDPLGAVILQHQPEATLPQYAAALALGGGGSWIPWVEGAADGLAGEAKNRTWIDRPVPAHVADRYLNGYEAAILLRIAILSRCCPQHGEYSLDALGCPTCNARAAKKLDGYAARGEA
jgi:hypothetical protein